MSAWEWASPGKIQGDLALTFPKIRIHPAGIAHHPDVCC